MNEISALLEFKAELEYGLESHGPDTTNKHEFGHCH